MDKKLDLILLVDDDVNDNFFHRMAIEEAGVANRIAECYDGEDALNFLKKEAQYKDQDTPYPRPDLIFLDINMPKVNGWEFLEEYEKLPDFMQGGPVIVMITSSINPKDEDKATKFRSLKEYYNKPLNKEMVIEIINKHFAVI